MPDWVKSGLRPRFWFRGAGRSGFERHPNRSNLAAIALRQAKAERIFVFGFA
jgi:hypothetical protein